ncbi:Putative uncharacterized protein [Lactococcus lactis subsp. lactis A12]|jgi:hypothetical protein
MMMS